MAAKVKVRYANGVLTPLEPLDIAEGEELVVSLAAQPPRARRNGDAPLSANGRSDASQPANQHETIVEMFDRLSKSVPPEEWDKLPTDLVKNKKHYMYGHPKEAD